ncbi:hypothetical protein KPNJ1_00807 [Klebsiella pneumoniae 30660/NJST258_1]|uniref:Uncharacterized protein n=1 Tax=Klebsiella pneumoniae 30684/NJST258_2 TaxID=1420013 RepID=W8UUP1_KLEPN|nr:hypothetical protein KPNJ2_00842 [Klebsiella pneumoniae 30684/NJST258_2]AHM83213.1 hypothetical protein KPNJ1_00807 [Klebsiella pneumoniae 30660/NJST258_1]
MYYYLINIMIDFFVRSLKIKVISTSFKTKF